MEIQHTTIKDNKLEAKNDSYVENASALRPCSTVKLGAAPFCNGPFILRSHWSEAAAPGLVHPWAPHFRRSEQREDKVNKRLTVFIVISVAIIVINVTVAVGTGAAVIQT